MENESKVPKPEGSDKDIIYLENVSVQFGTTKRSTR